MSESNPKAAVSWVAVVLGAVVASFVVGVEAMIVDAGKARAAPVPTRATIEVTQFAVPSAPVGEGFAVCPGTKRALGGGVIQSGPASLYFFQTASGPLDASGEPLRTGDGDIAKQWYAAPGHDSSQERRFRVFSICE